MVIEKRNVPLTVWVTPSDAAQLEEVRESVGRDARWPLIRPKRAAIVYGLLQAGLAHWKANGGALAARKRPFRPEESRPKAKRVRSRWGA
jgi:hypothetical protein